MSSTPDPGQLPADPRLAHPATYSRDAVVAALVSFYEGLPHVEPADICRAPAGGWPEISEASVAARGLVKTGEVVELLRRLPYLRGDNPWVAPDAAAVDYRAVVAASRGNRPWLWDLSGPGKKADPPRFPPWVVQLTSGADSEAACYMLDTMDGTVTKFVATGPVYPDPPGRYGPDDPRAWRDAWCDDRTVPLPQLVREWQAKYQGLQFLGMPGNLDWPGVLVHPAMGGFMSAEAEAIKKIYQAHGWPDDYKGQECRAAIREWWKHRN
ncbi:hypothetical protein BJ166DRAFT_329527 [Pestalotiopsis sp. NC0098]|nr:hypothetical protein BJ166DRAFT_329527 [Pestalotiopsis sp. NC0098]